MLLFGILDIIRKFPNVGYHGGLLVLLFFLRLIGQFLPVLGEGAKRVKSFSGGGTGDLPELLAFKKPKGDPVIGPLDDCGIIEAPIQTHFFKLEG